MYNPGGNFQKLQPQRINALFLHAVRQRESPKPVEQTVGQSVNQNSIGIDNLTGTHIIHVKAAFAFLDKVFHFSAFAVKTDQVLR